MHSFLNFLKKNKLCTAINITGLTVSMAFVLLLACYVTKQLRTDSFQQNADRIYLVASERQYESAYYLQTYLRQRYPEIEKTTAFAGQSSMEIHSGDNMVLGMVGIADSTFFDMFSFRLTEGSNEAWKGSVTSAVISRTLARTLFPGQDPVGQPVTVMMMGSEVELNVAAVMEDIDNSTIPYCDIMVRGEWLPRLNPSHNMGLGNSGSVLTFIMTWPGADIVSKTADMLEYFKEHWWIYEGGASKEVVLIPLDELYFHGGTTWSGLRVGDKSLVMLLLSVCIVLLLFAVLNYINLTTAQAGFRAREMATRRLLGDSRGQVIGRMLGETGILCVAAMLLAVLLAEALSPAASRLLGYDFSIFGEASAASIAAVVLLTAVLSVVSGIVPAAIISASRPIDVVRGTFRTRNRTVYSRVMIVVQNAVTAVMLVAVLTMALQIRAMIKAPLGYNTENILNVSTDIFDDISGPFVFRDRLLKLSCVDAVGLGEGTPLYGTNNLTMHYNGGLVSFQQFRGDDAYFEILGIREKQDNHTAEASWWRLQDPPAALCPVLGDDFQLPLLATGGIPLDSPGQGQRRPRRSLRADSRRLPRAPPGPPVRGLLYSGRDRGEFLHPEADPQNRPHIHRDSRAALLPGPARDEHLLHAAGAQERSRQEDIRRRAPPHPAQPHPLLPQTGAPGLHHCRTRRLAPDAFLAAGLPLPHRPALVDLRHSLRPHPDRLHPHRPVAEHPGRRHQSGRCAAEGIALPTGIGKPALHRNGTESRDLLPLWKEEEDAIRTTEPITRVLGKYLFRNGRKTREMLPLWHKNKR